MSGFDFLSAVFVDRNYNGKEFIMTDVFFSDELKKSAAENTPLANVRKRKPKDENE